jgi:hypothetical protein
MGRESDEHENNKYIIATERSDTAPHLYSTKSDCSKKLEADIEQDGLTAVSANHQCLLKHTKRTLCLLIARSAMAEMMMV